MTTVAPLDQEMARTYLVRLPGWSLKEKPDRIERRFLFADPAAAAAFLDAVVRLCESERYRPEVLRDGSQCLVTLYDAAIGGLHQRDFVMARRIDGVADGTYVPAGLSMGDVSPTARPPL